MNHAFIITISLLVQTISCIEIQASIYYDKISGKYTVIDKTYDTSAVAYATYDPGYESNGWDFLTISSYQGQDTIYTDIQKSFAMGYGEGYLTSDRIFNFYHNIVPYQYKNYNGEIPPKVRDFLIKNLKFIEKNTNEFRGTDPYWQHISSVLYQYKGLYEGFNSKMSQKNKIPYIDFLTITAWEDIGEGLNIDPKHRPDYQKMTLNEIRNYFELHTHCSSIIKVADDFSDVFFGHNSWFTYTHLMKVFKEYRFKSNNNSEKSRVVAFTSYPGSISSVDDFYITDQDGFISETTNNIFKTSLYNDLTPESIFTWMRVVVANRGSSDVLEWRDTFTKYNSGTYNNQFQIGDLKQVDTVKKVINSNALLIVEQMPSYMESTLVTEYLKRGYWPSYNIPFSEKIFEMSGYKDVIEEKPELRNKLDYNTCARAKIMRRDYGKIVDVEAYKDFILKDNFQNDELSEGQPNGTIAERSDLAQGEKLLCHGMIDAEFSSGLNVKGKGVKKIFIYAGPVHKEQEVFDWSTTKCNEGHEEYHHEGQNEKWDFDWVEYETKGFE